MFPPLLLRIVLCDLLSMWDLKMFNSCKHRGEIIMVTGAGRWAKWDVGQRVQSCSYIEWVSPINMMYSLTWWLQLILYTVHWKFAKIDFLYSHDILKNSNCEEIYRLIILIVSDHFTTFIKTLWMLSLNI